MLLFSFISLTPITTIIACNKKDQITDGDSNVDKTVELFSIIKTKISDTLDSSETKIYLDAKDLKMENMEVKTILDPIFKEAQKNIEVFVDNNVILDKIIEKVKNIINELNIQLKTEIPNLENLNNIISFDSLKAKMNGNDIKTLIDLIDSKQSFLFAQTNDFDYNLQLNLNFRINIENKEDSYNYNPKSAFITNNKNNLDSKRLSLANKLSTSLADQELNGKNIIDNVLNNKFKNYQESFSDELNTVLMDKNIKIEKSKNMEINREGLSFQLKTLKEKGVNEKNNYLNNFAKLINESESSITIVEKLFHQSDSEFYQFKNYLIQGDRVFTKNFDKFILTKWSIEGIELPERSINNIKIYHKNFEISNSWKNFYEILRFYLHPKERENRDFLEDGAYRISYKVFKDFEELKQQNREKRLYQWANNVKKQIDSKYLDKFLVNILDIVNKDFVNDSAYEFNSFNASIQLFSNQLSLYLVNNLSIHFYWKK